MCGFAKASQGPTDGQWPQPLLSVDEVTAGSFPFSPLLSFRGYIFTSDQPTPSSSVPGPSCHSDSLFVKQSG